MMTKEEWISAAATKLQPYVGDHSRAYAESLYQSFVADEPGIGWENDPDGAVDEEMSYWDCDE